MPRSCERTNCDLNKPYDQEDTSTSGYNPMFLHETPEEQRHDSGAYGYTIMGFNFGAKTSHN